MIKQWPGWLNYIAIFFVYFFIGIILNWIGGFHTDWRYICIFSAFWGGGYLAKWRFYERVRQDGTIEEWSRFW